MNKRIVFNYAVSCADCGAEDGTVANHIYTEGNSPQYEIWLCSECVNQREEEYELEGEE